MPRPCKRRLQNGQSLDLNARKNSATEIVSGIKDLESEAEYVKVPCKFNGWKFEKASGATVKLTRM